MRREFPPSPPKAIRETAVCRALRALVAVAVATISSGCAEVVGPRYVAAVDVRVPAVVQAELSLLTDFTVDAEVLNTGPATILYERWCNWRIEQLVNGSWAPAYAPVCSAETQEIHQLRIGERAVYRYPAHRSWRAGNGAQVPGTYRIVLTVYSGAPGTPLTDLDATVVASNSFSVR